MKAIIIFRFKILKMRPQVRQMSPRIRQLEEKSGFMRGWGSAALAMILRIEMAFAADNDDESL